MNNPGPIHIEHAPHDKRKTIIRWSPASEETKKLPLVFHRISIGWPDEKKDAVISVPIEENQLVFSEHWGGRMYVSVSIVNQEDETGEASASGYSSYTIRPDMPRNLTLSRSEHTMTFSWLPPDSDSEADDLRYFVIVRNLDVNKYTSIEVTRETVDKTSFTVEINNPGVYEVSVQARRYKRLDSHEDVGYLDSPELIERFLL